MKFFILLGGFAGFCLSLGSSLLAGNEMTFALRDAAVGCATGAILFKALRGVMLSSARAMLQERARAAAERGSNPAVWPPENQA